jgi:subtilisin family serine protease
MPSTLQLLLLACVSVQAITVPASGSNLATSKGNSKVSEPENEGFKAEAAKDTGYNLRMLTIKPGTLQTIKQSWLGLAKTGTYNYAPSAGAGVDVYVLDSGIKITHHDFAESRAKHFKVGMIQSVQQSRYVAAGMDDKRGHGTHVAGIIGAKRYGVAPKVHLYNVKVIGDDGKAPGWKFLYQAINDIVDTHISKLGTPGFRGSVINMSIGYDGEPDPVLAAALDNAKAVGILAFASAGNKNIDIGAVGASGGHYPCAYKAVTCIAAVNEEYQKAEISNYGAAVAFVAPGTGIRKDSLALLYISIT